MPGGATSGGAGGARGGGDARRMGQPCEQFRDAQGAGDGTGSGVVDAGEGSAGAGLVGIDGGGLPGRVWTDAAYQQAGGAGPLAAGLFVSAGRGRIESGGSDRRDGSGRERGAAERSGRGEGFECDLAPGAGSGCGERVDDADRSAAQVVGGAGAGAFVGVRVVGRRRVSGTPRYRLGRVKRSPIKNRPRGSVIFSGAGGIPCGIRPD